MARGVAVVGGTVGAAQAALLLAGMGVEVSVITPSAALGLDNGSEKVSAISSEKPASVWPLLLRAATHPLVTLYTNSDVRDITGRQGRFTVRATKRPRYVKADLCTGCGRCVDSCSVQVPLLLDGRMVSHSVIHAPILDAKTVPSAYCIEKEGIAPCRAACPLQINVQGFVSLLSKGKVDEALDLISDRAPLAGVLGRVCTHPCEDDCKRSELDSPVFIRALHRYAADHAPSGIRYKRTTPPGTRRERVAIVGSGPAGLAAAWELARRGYRPAVFESHAVLGGMLATGIPRFRLPHEVREREVDAIRALGVDIRTGVTVGRDVTFSDLRERGYRAFFLAIGAHENNRLNIPGEELEGVVDSMSLLFALNLGFGARVGSNVAVIGGGNSAVDSARTAKRRSRGEVRIIYRRTSDEMTAVKEEVEDAISEGITIDYLTSPVEILGDGKKVTGIRCQRMRLGEVEADGRRKPEPIPDSEFVIEADHVVAAIGQRPNTSPLGKTWVEIDSESGTIKADPITLETNVPGVFAGGDCVVGPNNVVEAVAAGLQAAESIDRYLRGRNMRKGRTLEKPQPVEVDVAEMDAAQYQRAPMPAIPYYKRRGNFEETTLGLPEQVAEREAARCLNCALCSECGECELACEQGAIFHKDSAENVDIGAELIVDFVSARSEAGDLLSGDAHVDPSPVSRPGIYRVEVPEGCSLQKELAIASAAALEVAAELRTREEEQVAPQLAPETLEPPLSRIGEEARRAPAGKPRVGVVLCRCGGSISSVIDFNRLTNAALQLPDVSYVQEISQACSEEGVAKITAQSTEWRTDKLVLAACRCCGLDQICFSCTDRRIMCLHNLDDSRSLSRDSNVEFVNIREQCAWVHGDDPASATDKAKDIVASGVARCRVTSAAPHEDRPVTASALVLGTGLGGLAAARSLAIRGYPVAVVSGPESGRVEHEIDPEQTETKKKLLKQLEERGVPVRPWPQVLELGGAPGDYEAVLGYPSETIRVSAGGVIVNLGETAGEVPVEASVVSRKSLLTRILARERGNGSGEGSGAIREFTIGDAAGIFVIRADAGEPVSEQLLKGSGAAAKALAYLHRGSLSPVASAVVIDSRLCRGCGDCADICPYIEMRSDSDGMASAYVDLALCIGCGACIACCPTGAISQPAQSDARIRSTMEGLLGTSTSAVGVR